MPDEEPVVWPDDPVEGESTTEQPEAAQSAGSDWPASFEEALKQSRAVQEPAAVTPAPAPAPTAEPTNEYPTQPSMPAITAKTVPPQPAVPEVAKTAPPEPSTAEEPIVALGTADEAPTSTFRTPIPAPAEVSAANGANAAAGKLAMAEPETDKEEPLEGRAELEVASEVAEAPEPVSEPEAEVEAVEPEAGKVEEPEPEPVAAAQPEPEPEKAPEPAPEAVKAAAEPEPEAAPKEEEWIPLPVNPPLPSWAPRIGQPYAAAERSVESTAGTNLPTWAPTAGGRTTSNLPAASRASSTPAPAASGASQPPAPAASQPSRASTPPVAQPAEVSKPKTSSWEIVPPKQSEQQKQAYAGPSPEDRSYSEWFAWAKRSGAPASACHAAAQGAFRALAAGHDMNTAVQWATLAMASPPGLVSASRQLYCAWYSLGNIDLKLPSPQAHAFATGAIAALEGGADAPTAHQAGLAAAGITG